MNFVTETQGKFFISHCFEAQTLQIRQNPRVFTSATGRAGSQIEKKVRKKKVRKIEVSEFGKLFDLVIEPPIPAHPSPAQCRQVHLDVLRVLWLPMGTDGIRDSTSYGKIHPFLMGKLTINLWAISIANC